MRTMALSGASKVPHALDIQSDRVDIVSDAAQRLTAQRSVASWGKLVSMLSKKSFTKPKEKMTQPRHVTDDFWLVPMAEAEAALQTHTDLDTHVVTAEEMNLLQQSVVGP